MHGFNFLSASVDCVMPASESVLVNGVIKLVPNDLSDDYDDEPIQPFQLQWASTPVSCLKPVHADYIPSVARSQLLLYSAVLYIGYSA